MMSPLLKLLSHFSLYLILFCDCFYIYLSISTTPEALFSERERNVENDEDSIFIYIHISRSSINASRAPSNWSRRCVCFFFFVRGAGREEKTQIQSTLFQTREKT